MISVAIISVFLISGGVWMLRKIWPSFRTCPICAGVSGTWLWILAGIYLGWLEADSWKLIAALAMGGTVVGIAYQVESKVRTGKVLAWKILFIPSGFAMAYNLIYFSWFYIGLLSVTISLILIFFLGWPIKKSNYGSKNKEVADLEKKMENCC